MQKTLYLLRHAKSSWDDFTLSDKERPLNKRGKRDAPFMVEKFSESNPTLELIISSPAKRAHETAKIFAGTLGLGLALDTRLYDAQIPTLLKIIQETFEHHDSIMLVGHNPEFNMLNDLLSDKEISNLPTCGLVAIGFENGDLEKGKRLHYMYPKLYKELS